MSKPVIIDSSLLIEYIKGGKSKLLLALMNDVASECFVNETVISEFLFYWLGVNGGKSPLSMQSSRGISDFNEKQSILSITGKFFFLSYQ